MDLKRSGSQDGEEEDGPAKRRRPWVNLMRGVVEAQSMHRLLTMMEPFLRRVIQEELESALYRRSLSIPRMPRPQIQSAVSRRYRLRFRSKLPHTLFTASRIEAVGHMPVEIIMIDTILNEIITSGPLSTTKIDILVLDGEFGGNEEEEWTEQEFSESVVRQREGKRPLLTGELVITLNNGVGYLGNTIFTDNSSWIRSRKFRLGAKVHQSRCSNGRIHEAITEPFLVKDHRGELYKKHHPPALSDEVWRLEKIGKDGIFHKRLSQSGINTVQDFLRFLVFDHNQLRSLLGGGMTNKIWDATIKHVGECVPEGKLYSYSGRQGAALIFNSIFQLVGAKFDNIYYPLEDINASQKVLVNEMKELAYRNPRNIVEYNEPLIGSLPMSLHTTDGSFEEPYMSVPPPPEQPATYQEPATRLSPSGHHLLGGHVFRPDQHLSNSSVDFIDMQYDDFPMSGLSAPETFKAFSTRFVRLNGILFTRTSLETFDEVLSLILNILRDLLSSGPKEDLNFGQDATENGLVFVRFIAILIFSVHNVYKESEGQSYAEILQRAVVLQNAFSAAFEFVGYILKRCIELDDVASSYLLPAILVFMEWLACHPDIATRNDVEEKEAGARSFFWKQCVSLINILMGSGLVSIGGNDDDTSCFSDMCVYDERETGNRLALWEDIELRGFSPLVPAHLILDFSRKHPSGNDGSYEEKKARVNRILAAGRTLVHEVVIDHQGVYYDCSLKKFVIGTKPATYDDCAHTFDASKQIDVKQTSPGGKTGIAQFNKMNLEGTQMKEQVFAEGEEDDEEIVFQPSVTEKYPSLGVSKSNLYDSIHPVQHCSGGDLLPYADSFSTAVENLRLPSAHKASPQLHAAVPSVSLLPPENLALRKSNYFIEQELSFANGLKNMNIAGSGFCANPVQELPNGLQYMAPLSFSSTAVNSTPNITMPYQNNVAESTIPSKLDSIVSSGPNHTDLSMKSSVPFPATSRKNPVSRPVRHLGPPPGFGNGPSNKMADSFSKLVLNGQLPPMDDYRWLDGYQTPSTKGNGFDNFQNYNSDMHAQFATSNNNGFNDALSFPFPGKQSPMVPAEAANVKKWQELNLLENLKVYSEQQLPQGNQQPALLPEQYQAQSLWSSQYFV